MTDQLELLKSRGLLVDNDTAALNYLARIGYYRLNGCLPVWVAIEVWDFGLLSRLFEGMQFADKNRIAAKYGLNDGEQLAKWLKSLNFVRNVSAHHSRLWNINVLELSACPTNGPKMNHSRPFMYFSVMAQLLAVICPNSSWTRRLIALIDEFPNSRNGMLTLQDFGVVEGAIEWLNQFQK